MKFRRRRPSPIHVSCACNRKWLPHAATLIHSLLTHNSGTQVHFIAGEGISPAQDRALAEMVERLGGDLTIHRVPRERLGDFAELGTAPTWYRTFLPELLPDLDRVIHVDVDAIVLDDLRPLWETDLAGQPIAAVPIVFPSPEWGDRHCAWLGLEHRGLYCNTGIAVFDLGRLRDEGLMEAARAYGRERGQGAHAWSAASKADPASFRELARDHPDSLLFPDQDAINAVLGGRWARLAPRWNSGHQLFGWPLAAEAFSAEELAAARDEPAIRHFEGAIDAKPWYPGYDNPDRELYWRHRNATPWPAEPATERSPEIHANPGHPHEEFFEPWREARRQRYAGRAAAPARKRRAVVTIVHNEPVFLPLWLRYYSRFFAAGDIYVLDNETDDGSTDGDGFQRVPVAHDRVDHVWMAETLADFQHELLDDYEVVLVCDVDEILAPDPAFGDLGAYIDRLDEEFVNALGYEVLHLPDREEALDLQRPVLSQRGYWFANDAYDKPALTMTPLRWVPGLHKSADGRHNYDPDLRLIHLHRMDYELCRTRHLRRIRRRWGDRDLEQQWAAYNRLAEGEEFDRWFLSETGFESAGIELVLERVPERWREVV